MATDTVKRQVDLWDISGLLGVGLVIVAISIIGGKSAPESVSEISQVEAGA